MSTSILAETFYTYVCIIILNYKIWILEMDSCYYEELGLLIDLRLAAKLDTSAELVRQAKNSILTNNYSIFYNKFSEPKGYIIWAKMNKYSLLRLLRVNVMPRYFYEWDEGPINYILDIVLIDRPNKNSKLFLMNNIKSFEVLAFSRNNVLKLFLKRDNIFKKTEIDLHILEQGLEY